MVTFTRQDARYMPASISLDDYTAADMMADLGIHRRSALPLAGRALIIPPPPPDINKRGPRLAKLAERNAGVPDAWGALYDPALAEDRDDGLGEGQMHRTGPNYRPVEPCQRSPPRTRRTRYVGVNESSFELGKRPGKAPYPKGLLESSQVHRRLIERRRNRSPDELEGPPGDILAPLRIESMLKNEKTRAVRPLASLVSHHLAGNPPILRKVFAVASSHTSRIIPDNPDVSHWNAGKLAIASKGGYDYMSTPKKLSISPGLFPPQTRELNKVSHTIPLSVTSIIPLIPSRPAPGPSLFSSRPVPFTAPRPAPPVPLRMVSSAIPGQNVGWDGDKPFNSQAGVVKLTDVTNGVSKFPEVESHALGSTGPVAKSPDEIITATKLVVELLDTIASTEETNKMESDKPPTNLLSIGPEDALSHNPKPREPLDSPYVVNNTKNSDNNSDSENGGSAYCNPPDSVRDIWSSLSGEDPDLTMLHRDFYTLRKDVERLKAKVGNCDTLESSLLGRMRLIRQIRNDILAELQKEEGEMDNIRREIRILRLNHINLVEGLRAKRMEVVNLKNEISETKLQVELSVVAGPQVKESGDVQMADVRVVDTVCEEEVGVKAKQAEMIRLEIESFEKGHLATELPTKDWLEREIFKTQQLEKTRPEALGAEISQKLQTEEKERHEIIRLEADTRRQQFEKDCLEKEKSLKINLLLHKEDNNFRKNLLKETYLGAEESLGKEHVEKTPFEQKPLQKVGVERLKALPTRQQLLIEAVEGKQGKDEDAQCTQREEAKKGHLEEDHLQQQYLEREFYDNARIEVNRRNKMARLNENVRHEEQLLVKEHLEKVRLQEERIEAARTEKARLDAEKLEQEPTAEGRANEPLKEESLESKLENMCIGKELVKEGYPETDNQTTETVRQKDGLRANIEILGPVDQQEESKSIAPALEPVNQQEEPKDPTAALDLASQLEATITTLEHVSQQESKTVVAVSEQEIHKITVVGPEPVSPPPSPTQFIAIPRGRVAFPYKIDLDLRPVFNVPPLRVKIVQHGRPQEAIVKDCKDLLTSVEFETLNEMPHFQQFLVNCNERHTRKLARFYGNTGEY